ncbi:MAG: efflux RND transporter permease subunit [Bacteroidota bacterium]
MRGAIAWMARNGVASNLLMVALIAAGIVALTRMVIEVFPEFSLDAIQVSVVYPGATPEEVEESIVQKIEEQIEAVEGIDEVTATASEGRGVVTAQLRLGTDVAQALDDIKGQVDQITTFPAQAEEPLVRELTNRQSVLKLALYSDPEAGGSAGGGVVSERALKEIAYRVEDEIAALPEVSYVEASNVRLYEVSVEVPQATLRRYGLSLTDVSQAVAAGSLELSAGSIETSEEEIRVRTLGRNYTQQDFEDVVVVGSASGAQVRLGDIAEVRDAFEDADLVPRYNGEPTAFVEVFRTSDERVLTVTDAVFAYLDAELRPSLPRGVAVEVWEDDSRTLRDRISLLLKNAAIGLGLVLLALTLFLNVRLAFWTAVGIGISFVGALAVLYALGYSINQLSLFGFILAIGIVVDDAIVVGENIYAQREKGRGPLEAAVEGAKRVATPVTFAVLTTMAAFSPLLAVPGTLGKILVGIPVVVIAVLALSLVESLLVLPYHLSHLPEPGSEAGNPVTRSLERARTWVDRQLQRFVNGPLERALQFATSAPSVILASALGLAILAVALVPAGLLRVEFFPAIEGDIVIANLELPQGTAAGQTQIIAERIEAAGRAVADSLAGTRPEDAPPLVEAVYSVVGRQAIDGGPDGAGPAALQSNLATVQFKLLEAERREIPADAFAQAWRDRVGGVPQARSLTFSADLLSAGAAVSVELSHPDNETLQTASAEVMDELGQFGGVFDIRSDLSEGTTEVQLELTDEARTLGLTLRDVADQVRAAFFGDQALRVQRGREDVRVYVRLPEAERDALADVEDVRVIAPGGASVPLARVATTTFGTSPSSINRKDGRRVATVTADTDPAVVTGQEITSRLRDEILPAVRERYPQLETAFGGEQEEQAESGQALGRGFLLALLVIYALLAIPFRSYIQPLVIMSAIPFGIIGALAGHLLLDLSVGLLSVFGIIGLSGVVVNDSLVMIDFINERRLSGMGMREAIVDGAKSRFRPILLTSITTFLGVAPLVLETSLQAQFLIPMAAALGFGILFATGILMLLVPALAMIQYTVQTAFETKVLGRVEDEVEVVHSTPRGDHDEAPASEPDEEDAASDETASEPDPEAERAEAGSPEAGGPETNDRAPSGDGAVRDAAPTSEDEDRA